MAETDVDSPLLEPEPEAAETPEDDADDLEPLEPEMQLAPVPDDGLKRRWYALHAHSGQESTVREMLLVGAEQMGINNLITNVLVPIEKVEEVRSGVKRETKRKFFPGYVLAQLPLHPEKFPEIWALIEETPGVTGFIPSRTQPTPLDDEEVMAVVEVARGERERPKPQVAFSEGERVKIIEGPFANFLGSISEINADAGTLKVMVEIFERLTSVEVELWQVEQV